MQQAALLIGQLDIIPSERALQALGQAVDVHRTVLHHRLGQHRVGYLRLSARSGKRHRAEQAASDLVWRQVIAAGVGGERNIIRQRAWLCIILPDLLALGNISLAQLERHHMRARQDTRQLIGRRCDANDRHARGQGVLQPPERFRLFWLQRTAHLQMDGAFGKVGFGGDLVEQRLSGALVFRQALHIDRQKGKPGLRAYRAQQQLAPRAGRADQVHQQLAALFPHLADQAQQGVPRGGVQEQLVKPVRVQVVQDAVGQRGRRFLPEQERGHARPQPQRGGQQRIPGRRQETESSLLPPWRLLLHVTARRGVQCLRQPQRRVDGGRAVL